MYCIITFHSILLHLPRFKNVHKRKAEQDRVARINEELDSPSHEPSFSEQSFASGLSSSLAGAGGSGVRSRVGFNEEVPSQPKNSRRDAAFPGYQQHQQQQQHSQTHTQVCINYLCNCERKCKSFFKLSIQM